MLWAKQRKWGYYLTLFRCPWFAVKLLFFKKYGELSYQRHFTRSEWWMLIKGDGKATIWAEDKFMEPFDTVLVKTLRWHTFKAFNPSVILEFQWGSRVSEEDIERL